LGADVDFSDEAEFTALHHAVLSGFEDCVRELIEWGSDVNATTLHGLPLNLAAQKERGHVIEILVSARADEARALAFAAGYRQSIVETSPRFGGPVIGAIAVVATPFSHITEDAVEADQVSTATTAKDKTGRDENSATVSDDNNVFKNPGKHNKDNVVGNQELYIPDRQDHKSVQSRGGDNEGHEAVARSEQENLDCTISFHPANNLADDVASMSFDTPKRKRAQRRGAGSNQSQQKRRVTSRSEVTTEQSSRSHGALVARESYVSDHKRDGHPASRRPRSSDSSPSLVPPKEGSLDEQARPGISTTHRPPPPPVDVWKLLDHPESLFSGNTTASRASIPDLEVVSSAGLKNIKPTRVSEIETSTTKVAHRRVYAHTRSRCASPDRTTRKDEETQLRKPGEIRRLGREFPQTESSRRRRSSRSVSHAESGLLSSDPVVAQTSHDDSSLKGSRVTNSSKVQEWTEDTVQRTTIPEINALKEGQRVDKNHRTSRASMDSRRDITPDGEREKTNGNRSLCKVPGALQSAECISYEDSDRAGENKALHRRNSSGRPSIESSNYLDRDWNKARHRQNDRIGLRDRLPSFTTMAMIIFLQAVFAPSNSTKRKSKRSWYGGGDDNTS
jgi:hypothetical protein